MQPGNILRAGIIVATVATLGAALVTNRYDATAPATVAVVTRPIPDDLSAELQRCNKLGPQDAEDTRCEAVWKENRGRFFGRPARPPRPDAAPALSRAGDPQ